MPPPGPQSGGVFILSTLNSQLSTLNSQLSTLTPPLEAVLVGSSVMRYHHGHEAPPKPNPIIIPSIRPPKC